MGEEEEDASGTDNNAVIDCRASTRDCGSLVCRQSPFAFVPTKLPEGRRISLHCGRLYFYRYSTFHPHQKYLFPLAFAPSHRIQPVPSFSLFGVRILSVHTKKSTAHTSSFNVIIAAFTTNRIQSMNIIGLHISTGSFVETRPSIVSRIDFMVIKD